MQPRSALDAFFSPAASALDVLRAARSLDRSRGRIEDPEHLRARGGYLVIPGGVVHPAIAPAIAALLDVSAERLLAIAGDPDPSIHDDEARALAAEGASDDPSALVGMGWIRRKLMDTPRSRLPAELAADGFSPADLLIEVVPVLPPGDRPFLAMEDPTILVPQPGPVNVAYVRLINRANRLARLEELSAPYIILANERVLAQRTFEDLLAAITGAPARERPPLDPDEELDASPDSERAMRLPDPATLADDEDQGDESLDTTVPLQCLWLDEDRWLIQFPLEVFVVARGSGAVLLDRSFAGAVARSTDEEGRRVVFFAGQPSWWDGEAHGVAVLDTKAGAWLDEYPKDLRAVTVVNDQPEDALLNDLRTDTLVGLDIPSDRPGLTAISRDHRFLWAGGLGVSGQIIAADTGICHVDLDALDLDARRGPFLLASGELAGERPDADSDDDAWGLSAAFALTSDRRWRFLTPEGIFVEGTEARFAIGFPWCSAAFSPSGDRLLVCTRDEALVIDPSPRPRIVARVWLGPPLERLRQVLESHTSDV